MSRVTNKKSTTWAFVAAPTAVGHSRNVNKLQSARVLFGSLAFGLKAQLDPFFGQTCSVSACDMPYKVMDECFAR